MRDNGACNIILWLVIQKIDDSRSGPFGSRSWAKLIHALDIIRETCPFAPPASLANTFRGRKNQTSASQQRTGGQHDDHGKGSTPHHIEFRSNDIRLRTGDDHQAIA